MDFATERTYSVSNKKIFAVITAFVLLAISLVMMTYYGNKIVTATRAYVAGEGFWTKAQKEAVLDLTRYLDSGQQKYFKSFNEKLEVNMGDKRARLTLSSGNMDYDEAYRGFLQGDNHPDDIPQMIWLFQNFGDLPQMERAIDIWRRGDEKIAELTALSEEIKSSMQQGGLNQEQKSRFVEQIYSLDSELTELENRFSSTMGETARMVTGVVFWLTLGIGMTLVSIISVFTIRFMRNVREWNRQLSESEAKFRNVLQHSRDVVYQMNLKTGEYVYMSPSVEEMTGFSSEEMLEKGPEFVIDRMHPDDLERMERELQEIRTEGVERNFSNHTEFRVRAKNGEYVWVSNKRSLIHGENGEPAGIVGSVRDISDRKKYEERIDRSLEEKEILLKEIHHRVKNNLAIISSLLELQKEDAGEKARDIFRECQSRIQSIAMVHEKLYKSENLSEIQMPVYIEELAEVISRAYNLDSRELMFEKDYDEIKLDVTDAIPCGLIFNELLNNVYKHAFTGREDPRLKISLKRRSDKIHMSVSDNGPGLPENFNIDRQQSLGMTLIRTLVIQLKGDLEISSNGWTEFKVIFEPSA